MGKIGRNEPCPCGSGKKYKYCCGETGGNILQFPGIPTEEEMNNIPEGLTWQESRGTPNPATDSLNQLKQDMAGRVFGSPDEMNDFVRKRIELKNQTPLDDFLGISPSLMHRISSLPLSENQEFLSLTGKVAEKDVPGIPILLQGLWLLNRLHADGPVNLTKAGYLPPSFALNWFDETFRLFIDKTRFRIGPVRRESDDMQMVWVRNVLKGMKLLFARKGQLGISTKGRAFLKARASEQYRQFFYFLADERDWSANDEFGFKISPFHQNSLPFFLHVLNRQGNKGLNQDDVQRIYTRAFPYNFDAHENNSYTFFLVLFEPASHFTEPLGLSNLRSSDFDRRVVVRSELFRRVLRWGDWATL